jgi:imidazoleglycerol phosphate dehydratase HisB
VRTASIQRETRETQIQLELHVDGGAVQIDTPVPFFSHMLDAFACHGRFGLTVRARGDIEVDPHHLIEDTGIVLGQAVRQALGGDYRGIERAGFFTFPMDGTLTTVALDLCGRPTLVWQPHFGPHPIGNLDPNLFRDFFKGFADSARGAVHVHVHCQDNDHHLVESAMKGFGRALRRACQRLDTDQALSTKGVIDA